MWSPAFSASASAWQCASAPARPPRSPPFPLPRPVMKKVITDFAPPIGRDAGAPCAPAADGFTASVCAPLFRTHVASVRGALNAAQRPLTPSILSIDVISFSPVHQLNRRGVGIATVVIPDGDG